MQFTENDVKKIVIGTLLVILSILVFVILKPVFVSVISGLLLAYIMLPVYKLLLKGVKNKNLAAWILLLVLALLIAIPFWLLLPKVIDQFFSVFRMLQTLDIPQAIKGIFPGASEQFVAQLSFVFNDLVSKLTNLVLAYVINLSVDIPYLLIHLVIIGFVFFFTIKDADSLVNFLSEISPLGKSKKAVMASHFKSITDSILFGQVLAGIIQGLFAGIGFYLLGLENTALLTLFAVILSILPFIGVFMMWVPINIYLFATGNTTAAFIYLIYNLTIVSNIDNVVRTYVVSKKTEISQAVIFIGMMGGIFVFGIVGLVLGPLILGYFIILLKSYKDKTLYTLFSDEK